MPWPPDIVVAMIGVVVLCTAIFGACIGAAWVTSRFDREGCCHTHDPDNQDGPDDQ